jgi:predicted DNA-binding transcriptional regulator YafY
MSKGQRQQKIIKLIAISPWTYTAQIQSDSIGVRINTNYRAHNELEANGYRFVKNESGRLFLQELGWNGFSNIKDSTVRQIEILRFIASYKQGVNMKDILNRFAKDKEISAKTIERDLKELANKHLIDFHQGCCAIKTNQLLPPLQLDALDKSILMEALTLQGEISARKDEAQSILAKLRVSLGVPSGGPDTVPDTVVVHGRRPIEKLRRSHFCQRLEEYARNREKVTILYRRNEEAAYEVQVNPLGIVYYWALDNWYLVAQIDSIENSDNSQQIKTYLTDRILFIEPSGESFVYPDGFSLENWFKYSGEFTARVIPSKSKSAFIIITRLSNESKKNCETGKSVFFTKRTIA